MFYSQFILAKKGPLGTIWIAAHLERKLRKNQVTETNIPVSVDSILFSEVPIALRLSGHLLLGVVRIYSRKVGYLYADCSDALVKIKQAFNSAAVDLPPDAATAPFHSITMPENFDLETLDLAPDIRYSERNGYDHNVASREQITLGEPVMDDDYMFESQIGPEDKFELPAEAMALEELQNEKEKAAEEAEEEEAAPTARVLGDVQRPATRSRLQRHRNEGGKEDGVLPVVEAAEELTDSQQAAQVLAEVRSRENASSGLQIVAREETVIEEVDMDLLPAVPLEAADELLSDVIPAVPDEAAAATGEAGAQPLTDEGGKGPSVDEAARKGVEMEQVVAEKGVGMGEQQVEGGLPTESKAGAQQTADEAVPPAEAAGGESARSLRLQKRKEPERAAADATTADVALPAGAAVTAELSEQTVKVTEVVTPAAEQATGLPSDVSTPGQPVVPEGTTIPEASPAPPVVPTTETPSAVPEIERLRAAPSTPGMPSPQGPLPYPDIATSIEKARDQVADGGWRTPGQPIMPEREEIEKMRPRPTTGGFSLPSMGDVLASPAGSLGPLGPPSVGVMATPEVGVLPTPVGGVAGSSEVRRRPAAAPAAKKRKKMQVDNQSTVLPSDVMRQQLTDTSDIRRPRRKASVAVLELEAWARRQDLTNDNLLSQPAVQALPDALLAVYKRICVPGRPNIPQAEAAPDLPAEEEVERTPVAAPADMPAANEGEANVAAAAGVQSAVPADIIMTEVEGDAVLIEKVRSPVSIPEGVQGDAVLADTGAAIAAAATAEGGLVDGIPVQPSPISPAEVLVAKERPFPEGEGAGDAEGLAPSRAAQEGAVPHAEEAGEQVQRGQVSTDADRLLSVEKGRMDEAIGTAAPSTGEVPPASADKTSTPAAGGSVLASPVVLELARGEVAVDVEVTAQGQEVDEAALVLAATPIEKQSPVDEEAAPAAPADVLATPAPAPALTEGIPSPTEPFPHLDIMTAADVDVEWPAAARGLEATPGTAGASGVGADETTPMVGEAPAVTPLHATPNDFAYTDGGLDFLADGEAAAGSVVVREELEVESASQPDVPPTAAGLASKSPGGGDGSWSARTRNVGKYLQSAFESLSEHQRRGGESSASPEEQRLGLDRMVAGKPRREAARMFFETLVLTTRDYISVEQALPYGDVLISARPKLLNAKF
eukprot:TRINITY_DN16765_c0_g1_i1.p1 TRINITY_DN16765_c0_g1~~TRINITY_DN16765_c0_g1_i1.p1  ORF type:complete len:1175 (+),score=305.69 TRINITY_DN16765_c0_g1_i1:188-3712(+)